MSCVTVQYRSLKFPCCRLQFLAFYIQNVGSGVSTHKQLNRKTEVGFLSPFPMQHCNSLSKTCVFICKVNVQQQQLCTERGSPRIFGIRSLFFCHIFLPVCHERRASWQQHLLQAASRHMLSFSHSLSSAVRGAGWLKSGGIQDPEGGGQSLCGESAHASFPQMQSPHGAKAHSFTVLQRKLRGRSLSPLSVPAARSLTGEPSGRRGQLYGTLEVFGNLPFVAFCSSFSVFPDFPLLLQCHGCGVSAPPCVDSSCLQSICRFCTVASLSPPHRSSRCCLETTRSCLFP